MRWNTGQVQDRVAAYGNRRTVVFSAYWLVVFTAYLPAAMAGRVGDFPGWVQAITSKSFFDYVNRTGSGIASMYQFTQVVSWFFYQLFGANAWCWHLLYVTMQALNALLLFTLFRRLFVLSSVKYPGSTAFVGGLLFCLCPYISEVVVWEPSFHYLLGFLLMLSVLNCVQVFAHTKDTRYAWLGGVLFFLSTFSLEVFYLTPFFVLTLAGYYHIAGGDITIARRIIKSFVLPQALFFALHLLLLGMVYHGIIAHQGSISMQFSANNFSKPPKYIFHILFFGRFYSGWFRNVVYHFFESRTGMIIFYGLLVGVLIYIVSRFRRFKNPAKIAVLLFLWCALAIGLILPLWFPVNGLVIYDRYTYVADALIMMLVALLANNIASRQVYYGVIAVYALLNFRYTHKANAYWRQSADIVNHLVATFPNDTTKKVLLLNLPECLEGVQMVGTRDDGEFRILYNSVMPHRITNEVYDVEAFYMRGITDGAHVNVLNDSTVRVELNQWGTWWLYYGYGATSYENKDFKVDMRDMGRWYLLVLKRPPGEYLLLYTVGRDWHKVDWSKKGPEQN